jgi:hypothetical protein
MSYTTLHTLKQLAKAYSGNENPGIFLLSDETDDTDIAFEPTCVFIDDDGDIIIQFNPELLYN